MPRSRSAALLVLLALAAPAAAIGPRFDRHGDPLPPGAVQRFGTARMTFGAFPPGGWPPWQP